MALDSAEVRHVSLLSRIELTDTELDMFTRQLADIVAYVDQLNEADTRDVPPMEHTPREDDNVLRDDVPVPGIGTLLALGGAPDVAASHFRVPKVVE
ncbi:MAG: Asp-tRNA(Asn)/Glu-tRNA(Gln) amidotransferase subunit GatC [Planctomycetes bacterium]|nr:Asp-tRNA(Asn)/Glu-tRNA(Gln) amidotransferase subunit GatC [Planctomycetota bacterium]